MRGGFELALYSPVFLSINMPSMDSRPPTSETPPRRRPLFRLLAVSLSLLVILVVLFLAFAFSNSQFTWLTPAQMTQASRPGLLTQLKYKLIRLAGPLMRYYHTHRPNILIAANVFTASPVAGQTDPDIPGLTNADGTRAWILPPQELSSFRQRLKTNTGISLISGMNIQTRDGMSAGAALGRTMTVNVSTGAWTNIGTSIDVLPKKSAGIVSMLINARSTESLVATTNGAVIITNFSTACRALIPDAGALVLNCRNTDPANPTNYWLIVSPMLVDATGKPIKP
jgi:hypothetical protein